MREVIGGSWLDGDKDNRHIQRRKDVLDPTSESQTKGQASADLPFAGQGTLDVPVESLSTGDSESPVVSFPVSVGVPVQCF